MNYILIFLVILILLVIYFIRANQSYKNAPMAKSLFKNLQGIDFNKVSETSNLLNDVFSDVNGNWYFNNERMIMLMKSFTMDTANTALDNLLISNNINIKDVEFIGEIKYWKGNGFNIEFPPEKQGIRLIVVTIEPK